MSLNENEGFKALRKEKKISQTELSKKSGIHRNYISDFENGRNNPTDKTIRKLLEPLGISYVDFLIDYCGVKRVENDEEAMERALYNSKNENDPTQQFFSSFVDIADIKGFEFDGEPLSDKEQTALLSIIELIKSNKD
ncbi:helix-turn-helix domain-containing protein [Carnobacterium jeotgali]